MKPQTAEELAAVLRPIASLISKSEKARQKLKPGMWQHTMLRENVSALRIASALMCRESGDTAKFTRGAMQEALRALHSMAGKTAKSKARFSPGTSQHTLLRNRLRALRVAESLVKAELA